MLPISFDPALPWLALTLALGSPLIALAMRRRSRPAPPRRQIAAALISCVAGLVVVLIGGLVLERCVAEVLMRSSHGAGMGDPMSWLGAAAVLLSGGSWMAWQVMMLLGPLLFAMDTLADRRLPARLISTCVMLMISPLFAALVLVMMPLDRPPTVLLAAILLWLGVLGLAVNMRRRATPKPALPAPSPRPTIAMRVVRQPAPPPTDETEISLLPAALARQVAPPSLPFPPRQPPIVPKPAPLMLPPAAVRRARRMQKTLADMPQRRIARR